MSFYLNRCNSNKPSCINPQELSCICEKALIEVNRVFDACIIRIDNQTFSIALTDFSPEPVSLPLTYISTEKDPYVNTIINSIDIDHNDGNNFATVTFSITIPLIVNYRDSNGELGTARSSITINRTTTLCVPENSLTPINIDINTTFFSNIGNFTSDTTASIIACIQIILKSVGKVDLLIPTFGYPDLPRCNSSGDDNCDALFRQPIYPTRT